MPPAELESFQQINDLFLVLLNLPLQLELDFGFDILAEQLRLHGLVQFIQALYFVQDGYDTVLLRRFLLFGYFFLDFAENIVEAAVLSLEPVSKAHYFFDADGGFHDGIENPPLSRFYPLGDLYFSIAREQRHLAHFPQIHLYRIGYAICGIRFELKLVLLFLHEAFRVRYRSPYNLNLLIGINDLYVHFIENHHHVVKLVGRDDFLGQRIVDLIEGQVTFFLARCDETVQIIDFRFVDCRIAPLLGILLRHWSLSPKRYQINR